jgi:protein translocase SEC61 complex gamma subunit
MFDIVAFVKRSMRVLNVSHRPKKEEFWMIAKTVMLGMVLVGATGFVITIIFSLIDRGGVI